MSPGYRPVAADQLGTPAGVPEWIFIERKSLSGFTFMGFALRINDSGIAGVGVAEAVELQ
jgi:hypothetical protein